MPIIFECDGCSTLGMPSDAWLQVSINNKPPLLFHDFECLGQWAIGMGPKPPTVEPLYVPPQTVVQQTAVQNAEEMDKAEESVHARQELLRQGNSRAQAQESAEASVAMNPQPAATPGPISVRCETGEHFKQGEAPGSGKEGIGGCDGAMPISMTDRGAPDKWIECSCWCHNAARREMVEAWNHDRGKYGLTNSGPLVVA